MNTTKFSEFKNKLNATLQAQDPDYRPEMLVRTILALAALGSMFLPWVTLDGAPSPINGADLLAHAFVSPERGAMFDISKLGTLALLFIPVGILVATVITFFKSATGSNSPSANTAAAGLTLIILILAAPVTSSDQGQIFSITIPQWGPALMIFAHAAILAHIWAEKLKGPGRAETPPPRAPHEVGTENT